MRYVLMSYHLRDPYTARNSKIELKMRFKFVSEGKIDESSPVSYKEKKSQLCASEWDIGRVQKPTSTGSGGGGRPRIEVRMI
jgi:hypothetical protein